MVIQEILENPGELVNLLGVVIFVFLLPLLIISKSKAANIDGFIIVFIVIVTIGWLFITFMLTPETDPCDDTEWPSDECLK